MKRELKSTTTMKKAVELGQAHLQYPRKLLKYIVMKVIVDRKRDYSSADPWAVFFYSLYKPKKPFRYGFASGIETERVIGNAGEQIVERVDECSDEKAMSVRAENAGNRSAMKDKETHLSTESNGHVTASDSLQEGQIKNAISEKFVLKNIAEARKTRVLLEVDQKGMRFVHHRSSEIKFCNECKRARLEVCNRARRSRSELPRWDGSRVSLMLDGRLTLPRPFYLPAIPKHCPVVHSPTSTLFS
ncbi:hypothetical protein Tcan_17987 [Toxocara canis]|uniref:Uncharacterized protein n=1 Tax=Toxocara canis TaxID=6265 RepID=A0A0B2W521_TOXCA|nr:hypothetical protein Tcan_17987 [Toxocara canis]